jgi:hypothetical protein
LEFRVFTLNDVLQLRIKDVYETFQSLKLAEMPFYREDEKGLVNFIQVGSKQLKLYLSLAVDTELERKKKRA